MVAVVDGRAIRTADVKRQAEASGASARQALEALIEAEVAYGEARRRGLEEAPEVLAAVNQTLVHRFLALGWTRDFTPAQVPAEDIRKVYERNQFRLDHPPLVEVRHIIAPRPAKGDLPSRAELRRAAEAVAKAARSVTSPEAFAGLAEQLSTPQVPLRHESLVTDEHATTVEEFAKAAFALQAPGAVSGVVETKFGYHVIYLVRRIPAEHRDLAAASDQIRAGIFPEVRRREFARYVDRLVERHQVAAFPQRLEALP